MNSTELIDAACQWLDGYLSNSEIAHFRDNMMHKAKKKNGLTAIAEDKAETYTDKCAGSEDTLQRIRTAYLQGYLDASDDRFDCLW